MSLVTFSEQGVRGRLTALLLDGNTVADYRAGVGQTDAGAGACSVWANQIGIAPSLTAAGGARPTIQADGSVLFDGVANVMATGAFTLNQPTMIYFVGKQVTWTINDYLWDGQTADKLSIYNVTATPQIRMNGGTGANDNSDFSVNVNHIVVASYNGASSFLQVDSNAAVSGNAGSTAGDGFTLGARTGPSAYGNIQVKEVIIRKVADSAATQGQIQFYLKQIYGTP